MFYAVNVRVIENIGKILLEITKNWKIMEIVVDKISVLWDNQTHIQHLSERTGWEQEKLLYYKFSV